jgi:hypothetical protein
MIALVSGYKYGRKFWQESSYLRIKNIVWKTVLPWEIQNRLPLKPKQHILEFDAADVRAEMMRDFPELEQFRISRSLNSDVIIQAKLRTPVLKWKREDTVLLGVDVNGEVFPLKFYNDKIDSLPDLTGSLNIENRREAVSIYQLLMQSKVSWTQNIQFIQFINNRWEIQLKTGTKILWGYFMKGDVDQRATRAETILKDPMFANGLQKIIFVSNERLVAVPIETQLKVSK